MIVTDLRRLRRTLLLFLLLAVIYLGQQALFVGGAPEPQDRGDWSSAVPGERLLLVQGATLDEEESASCRRDLALAAATVSEARVRWLGPDQQPSLLWKALDGVRSRDRLTVYLSGHGGGRNFGAGARMNFTATQLAVALAALNCRRTLVVLDCCWAGEFQRAFIGCHFASPTLLVTSTDATHMAPFPTSFLSPPSFGRDFFARYSGQPLAALAETNRAREGYGWLYPNWVGLQGQAGQY